MEQPGSRHPAPEPLNLVQDLANSFDLESGTESLVIPDDLNALAKAHGIDDPHFTVLDLERTRRLRDALRESCILKAGHDTAPSFSDILNEIFASVPIAVMMSADASPSLVSIGQPAGFDHLVARVQDAIYRGEITGAWSRLKACQSETCRWVYYDNSPSGRSRWCTMSVCGARAKMRTYRARSAGTSSVK